MIVSFTTNSYPDHCNPYYFENFSATMMVESKPYLLGLWDTKGGETYDKCHNLKLFFFFLLNLFNFIFKFIYF